jgi:hypothetical protein
MLPGRWHDATAGAAPATLAISHTGDWAFLRSTLPIKCGETVQKGPEMGGRPYGPKRPMST